MYGKVKGWILTLCFETLMISPVVSVKIIMQSFDAFFWWIFDPRFCLYITFHEGYILFPTHSNSDPIELDRNRYAFKEATTFWYGNCC